VLLGVSSSFWWVLRVGLGVVLGFVNCESLFPFCFLFLGVPFVYFLCN
jgi:hypothetical protein